MISNFKFIDIHITNVLIHKRFHIPQKVIYLIFQQSARNWPRTAFGKSTRLNDTFKYKICIFYFNLTTKKFAYFLQAYENHLPL